MTPNNDEMVFPDGSELGLFPLMNTLFDMVFLCFSVCLKPFYYLYPYLECGWAEGRGSHMKSATPMIGDRLEKSVLSLMGLMRTDPPFLRRESKG